MGGWQGATPKGSGQFLIWVCMPEDVTKNYNIFDPTLCFWVVVSLSGKTVHSNVKVHWWWNSTGTVFDFQKEKPGASPSLGKVKISLIK